MRLRRRLASTKRGEAERVKTLFPVVRSLIARRVFVCPGGFHAVANNQSGVRFTVSTSNTAEDIHQFLEILAKELSAHGIGMLEATSP